MEVARERVAGLVRDAGTVVALSGAGISVPSGIPDFRTPGSGIWSDVDPMEVAHIAVFRRDPERFWRICDANQAMWPDELTAEAGRMLLIPPPEG